jgi:hypothetical protein
MSTELLYVQIAGSVWGKRRAYASTAVAGSASKSKHDDRQPVSERNEAGSAMREATRLSPIVTSSLRSPATDGSRAHARSARLEC